MMMSEENEGKEIEVMGVIRRIDYATDNNNYQDLTMWLIADGKEYQSSFGYLDTSYETRARQCEILAKALDRSGKLRPCTIIVRGVPDYELIKPTVLLRTTDFEFVDEKEENNG
jgi:hypothetical protein